MTCDATCPRLTATCHVQVPGLMIIDTPGHESFSNLRSRGSSLCDVAILVIDIMHGLEPQTIESLNMLRSKKTPFVVALNKVDRLYGWEKVKDRPVVDALEEQSEDVKREFEDRASAVLLALAEQGLNAALYYRNKVGSPRDPRDHTEIRSPEMRSATPTPPPRRTSASTSRSYRRRRTRARACRTS